MSQMPEETDWKEAMRALTKVENVHLRAEMWQYLEPKELPIPRPKGKATVNKKKTAKAANKGSSRKEKRRSKEQQLDRKRIMRKMQTEKKCKILKLTVWPETRESADKIWKPSTWEQRR